MTSRSFEPTHPGILIRDEVLPGFEVDQTRAADILRAARPGFSRLLNGHRALTPEMALKVEKAFGVSADMLMQAQTSHDLAEARKRRSQIVTGIKRQTLKK